MNPIARLQQYLKPSRLTPIRANGAASPPAAAETGQSIGQLLTNSFDDIRREAPMWPQDLVTQARQALKGGDIDRFEATFTRLQRLPRR